MRKPIPDNAKMVFKGQIFEVWQWEQKMFDGRSVTFERLKRLDTVQVIAIEGDSILLLKERQPDTETYLTLPGGRMEEGEEPLLACKRELLEESGYVSNQWELFRSDSPVSKMEWTIYTYLAKNCRKIQEPKLDGGEEIELMPVSFDQFIELGENGQLRLGKLNQMLTRARFVPEELDAFRARLFG